LTEQDGHAEPLVDYCISNPPYGDDWKKYETSVRTEHLEKGFNGRYGAGLPKVSDGSFLFVQHMISKMKPYDPKKKEGGSRIAIILSGSPLFSGQVGSGESEIRRWIIENDWLDCIVSLPDSLFFNTGITTYIWIVTNKKNLNRKGKVQLIDGSSFYKTMKKSLGSKRKYIDEEQIQKILNSYTQFEESETSKIFDNEFFGYTKITIEQPLKENGREFQR
jgi:type I restriction enzyme M protein